MRDGWGAGAVAELLLTWFEVEVRGFPDLLERLYRFRGAVMVAAMG